MVDQRNAEKHRSKINKLVQERLAQDKGQDEHTVRKEVNKEQRAQRKSKKNKETDQHLDKIKQEIKAKMGDADFKAVKKATSQAIAKYHSEQKKGKNQSINKKCEQLMSTYLNAKWRPNEKWFGKRCQRAYDELHFLGAMMDINIAKNPAPMEKLFPEECKEYFDLLAKRRFKKEESKKEESKKEGDEGDEADAPTKAAPTEGESDAPKKKRSKPKSALNKKVQEILATNDGTKSDKEMLEKVISQVKEKEKNKVLQNLRKKWRPTDKLWFDQECKAAYKTIVAKGSENKLSLGEVSGDYKKFKIKFKTESKTYFKLLSAKKEAYDKEDKEKKAALLNEWNLLNEH